MNIEHAHNKPIIWNYNTCFEYLEKSENKLLLKEIKK